MNAIQQISLKLQLGIHPAIEVQPELLRAIWRQLALEQFHTLQTSEEIRRTEHRQDRPTGPGHRFVRLAD